MGTGWRAVVASVGRATMRRARRGPGEDAAAAPTAGARLRARVDEAVGLVRAVEAREPALPHRPDPRLFLALDRVVRRPELDDALRHLVPSKLAGDWDSREGVRRLQLALAADALVLGKLDLATRVKLRAGYAAAGLALAVQPVRRDGSCGVTNAVRSYEVVSRHVPGLAPRLHASGELPGYRYLVEEWVEGQPLASARRLAEELPALLESLALVHAGYGVRLRPASELWPRFPSEWETVRASGLVAPEVAEAVVDLLAQDRRLRVSWTHGDLAASNVLATRSGLTAIDWEHARERPVMFDGARLHLFAANPSSTVQRLVDAWGAAGDGSSYAPLDELALLHARFVCHAPARIARMAGHRRSAVYARQVQRQVERLGSVLEAAQR